MEKIDFTNCFERICSYGGSEKKKIVYDNKEYSLKFPDPVRMINVRTSYINNVYSEHIGCKVFESIGIPVQEVMLGTYKEVSDEQMSDYLMNQSKFKNIVYNIYPVYSYENKKLTYNEFYNMIIEEFKKTFFRVYPKIDLDKINNIIEDIPFISDVRKYFYKKSIAYRKKHILDVFYKKNR